MKDKEKKEKPNILFISIDGLRPKNLGCYGYKRNTSPNIDSLAKQGLLFKTSFSEYNLSYKSFLSILGGRHILGQDFGTYLSEKEIKSFFDTGGILLPKILKNHGYKTGFLKKLFGWEKNGFDYYFKQDSFAKSKKWNLIKFIGKIPWAYKISQYMLSHFYFIPKRLESKIRFNNSGERATDEAIKIIKQNKQKNFFLWLHYTDTHLPHVFPYSFKGKFVPDKQSQRIFEILNIENGYKKEHIKFLKSCWKINDTIEDIIARYDTAIFYNDFLTGRIINVLKEENLLENTIIFIFSDHGKSLGEHGLYFTHSGLYDVTFNVPLIIFGKGIPKNKKINTPVQLKDLAPTVLDLVKIPYDPFLFDGKSLLPTIYKEKDKIREDIFIEECAYGLKRRGIRTKRYKYMESPEKEHSICNVCNTSHGDIIALYDLEKDPDENINMAEKNKELLAEMKSRLDKKIKDLKTINEKRRIKTFISKTKHK